MTFHILQKLRCARSEDRPHIISDLYERNRAFFQTHYPAVDHFLDNTASPFSIQITDSFLSIVDERTGRTAHPEPLDAFAEMMGARTHDAWVDLFSLEVAAPEQYPLHAGPVRTMFERLVARFPEYLERYRSGIVNLKPLDEGRRWFSPPVIFLGIFHGLHIGHYLRENEVDSVLLVEPEPERFEVSLYFLDYEAIWRKERQLFLFIGPQLGNDVFDAFFSVYRITPHLWCRILPGGVMDNTPYYIEQFRMLQRSKIQVIYPLDYMIRDHGQGLRNLRRGLPLLSARCSSPQPFAIAVVASGPSLNQTLDWLRNNQDNLIIFAVHTAVSVLRQHGIRPDFQFCLDTVFHEDLVRQMDLFPDVPLVLNYQAAASYTELSSRPLLVAAADISHPLRIRSILLDHVAPSTTNLAFSFACHCRPRTIYLLGCDFGFRSPERHHALGSLYLDDRGEEIRPFVDRKTTSLVVPSNVPGTDPVLSTPFFMQARLSMEKAIGHSGQDIDILNLSDGALVTGARPARPEECIPAALADRKEEATERIASLFVPAAQGVSWQHYGKSGKEWFGCLQECLPDLLTMESFTWPGVARRVNTALLRALASCREDGLDRRMDIYSRLIGDMLGHLYICLLFFDSEEEAAGVYREGLGIFSTLLRRLQWPEELDG